MTPASPPLVLRPSLLGLSASLALLLVSTPSSAHGLDAGRYTVELEGATVRIVGTPRSTDLQAFDDDGDGLLARTEVRTHRAALREAVDAGFDVTDQDGASPVCEITDVSTPGSGDPRVLEPRADHLRFTRVCRFSEPPKALQVRDHFLAVAAATAVAEGRGPHAQERLPSMVDALEVSAPTNGTRTLLREVESVLLTSSAPTATVLRARAAPSKIVALTPEPARRWPTTWPPWSALLVVALAAGPSVALHRRRLRSSSPRDASSSPISPEVHSP